MRYPKLILLICTALIMFVSCTPSRKQMTDQAINDVMTEFQAVGISAAVVKDGKIVYNQSFGY